MLVVGEAKKGHLWVVLSLMCFESEAAANMDVKTLLVTTGCHICVATAPQNTYTTANFFLL